MGSPWAAGYVFLYAELSVWTWPWVPCPVQPRIFFGESFLEVICLVFQGWFGALSAMYHPSPSPFTWRPAWPASCTKPAALTLIPAGACAPRHRPGAPLTLCQQPGGAQTGQLLSPEEHGGHMEGERMEGRAQAHLHLWQKVLVLS